MSWGLEKPEKPAHEYPEEGESNQIEEKAHKDRETGANVVEVEAMPHRDKPSDERPEQPDERSEAWNYP